MAGYYALWTLWWREFRTTGSSWCYKVIIRPNLLYCICFYIPSSCNPFKLFEFTRKYLRCHFPSGQICLAIKKHISIPISSIPLPWKPPSTITQHHISASVEWLQPAFHPRLQTGWHCIQVQQRILTLTSQIKQTLNVLEVWWMQT